MTGVPWFRAKTRGWRWSPSTRQGWAVMAVWVAALAAWMIYRSPALEAGWFHFDALTYAGVLVLAAVLFVVCWLKGESPGPWR
jgi:hypothetical protein